MAKRKRIEAWAVEAPKGQVTLYTSPAYAWALTDQGYPLVHLIERDPAAEAALRAAVKHYEENGSRTHSNDCYVCAAVERYQKKVKR